MLAPYDFSMAYARCFAIPSVAMDRRHIFVLHDILAAWPFASALEIGSFNGASATAFVEAINGGTGIGERGGAMFCDVQVTHSLISVVNNCRFPDRVRVTPTPSCRVLDSAETFDFVLVDGAHDLASVKPEVERLLRRRPLCVMAHDTNATDAGYEKAEGAAMLRETFRGTLGYHCIEDCEKREGEETHRGLFFATNDPALYAIARGVFDKWRNE